MLDLFPAAWPDLQLDDVARFLDGAEDEPLQWEAKGTRLDPHGVRKTAGAFANSHDGGYLILGAEQVDGRWQLNGVSFPAEPAVWVSSTVRDGLRPPPTVDVKSFPVEGGHVAVVWVPPISDPPCVTRGTVYERLPGSSVPVRTRSAWPTCTAGANAHAKPRSPRPYAPATC
ncbi:MAG: AlbA family DNA-binding domain-containing protein [Solirubrobacteraceae bacterium]